MTRTIFILDIVSKAFWEVVYFPLWWYSRGLKKTAVFCLNTFYGGWRASALSIILRNFFRPMYGQKGWDAYALTLFARFWQVFFRLLFVAAWLALWLCLFLIWLVLPIFVIWQLL